MKIIVFSDTHLTDKFDPEKYGFLVKTIAKADKIIINGDFWDGYHTSFSRFINSQWKNLFPILKAKNTVYVYGNHDKKERSDNRVSLFSDKQTVKYELKINDHTYVFEHGNRLKPALDDTGLRFLVNSPLLTLMSTIEYLLHQKKFGKKFLKWYLSRPTKIIKSNLDAKPGHIYFFGHTHLAEKDNDCRYFNSGIVKCGIGQYLEIDTGKNTVELVEERY